MNTQNESTEKKPDPSFAEMWAEFRKLGPAGVLAIIALVFPALGGFALLGSMGVVAPWLDEHNALGLAAYIAAFIVLSGFALLPTYAQAILGGAAFGLVGGFPAALAGFGGGSIIGYFVARRAASGRVTERIEAHPKWLAVRDALIGAGLWRTLYMVTLIRIPMNSPFALTNLVLGSTRVAPMPYIVGTIVGMAPRTFVAVWIGAAIRKTMLSAGDSLEGVDLSHTERPWWLIPGSVVMTIIIAVIIGRIATRALHKAAGVETPKDNP